MEQLSVNMFWLGLVATAIATLLYWGHAFGVRLALRRAATNGQTLTVTSWERLPTSIGQAATLTTWLVAALLAAALVARWRATGHAPWSNMWEYTLAFAGGTSLAYALFERWYGQRTLGAFVQPVVLGLLAAAAAFFPSDVHPLVPALRNEPLLAAHVAMMVLAYSAFSVSFGAAVVYLVQGETNRFSRLPKAALLDEVGYRSVMVGFPLLALGIALGAYWANSAWGRYWGWDPKETSSLVTWLIYAGYLHMRSLRRWQGTRSAVLLVVGFLAVLFTYFGVNLWVSGLHSYSGV
ncbi:MAG: c-type cytochrome biogenesis protein CcsB [Dehalococcoidia bacterium]